jgi:hypothetical protein
MMTQILIPAGAQGTEFFSTDLNGGTLRSSLTPGRQKKAQHPVRGHRYALFFEPHSDSAHPIFLTLTSLRNCQLGVRNLRHNHTQIRWRRNNIYRIEGLNLKKSTDCIRNGIEHCVDCTMGHNVTYSCINQSQEGWEKMLIRSRGRFDLKKSAD